MLTYGELFAGYDGLGMGVRSVLGGESRWFAEFDKAPSKILAHHYPGVPNLGDVTKVDWHSVPKVDVITGGSPCQDLSHAGKRKGMTDGTRSNLWVEMREAVAVIRPRLVVWENVRGALSAPADSDLEPCPGCVGDGDDGPVLRALGRVLGDLSELGYDARWYGLRAADVGAAHGRFRVFLFATPADSCGFGGLEAVEHDGRRAQAGYGPGVPDEPDSDALRAGPIGVEHVPGQLTLLPTPMTVNRTSDKAQTGRPTSGPTRGGPSYGLEDVVTLLPTPAVNDMGAAYTPETWDAWTDRMKAEHGNGNGHGKSLAIEAQRLLPTPSVADGLGGHLSRSGSRSDELLLPGVAKDLAGRLLPTPRATDGTKCGPNQRGPSGDLMLPSAVMAFVDDERCPDCGCRTDLHDADGFCNGRCGGNDFDCYGRLGVGGGWIHSPARLLPTPTSSDAKASGAHGYGGNEFCTLTDATVRQAQDWREYEAAIRRWEHVIGRPAPDPTEPGAKGQPRLSPRFVEWLMGLPAGWVTDVPGITRNDMLKALGNGVVPAQAAAATRAFIHDTLTERAA